MFKPEDVPLKPEDDDLAVKLDDPTHTTRHGGVEVNDLPEPRRTSSAAPPPSERHMGITPLDLRQAKFGTQLRGFDRAEVTSLLLEGADGYERALRENERLRQEIVRLEGALNQFHELERSLRSTLITAQRVADDMRQNASQEAALLIRDAEGRAEIAIEKAQATVEALQRDIDGLRLKRREVETNIESTISTLHTCLDFMREQFRRETEDHVTPKRLHIEIAARQG